MKKKEGNVKIGHVSLKIKKQEMDDLERAVSIINSRKDSYGKTYVSTFCQLVIMREVNQILKKGK